MALAVYLERRRSWGLGFTADKGPKLNAGVLISVLKVEDKIISAAAGLGHLDAVPPVTLHGS